MPDSVSSKSGSTRSPESLAVKMGNMDPFEDHCPSSPQFSPVAFTLKNPNDFETWYYTAKATAGEPLWSSIDPQVEIPTRSLLEEPPFPTIKTVKPDIAGGGGLEELTDKQLRLLQLYREEWKNQYYKYLRQETHLYHFNLWLFHSIAPQFWSYFKREETVRDKMLAIKHTLDLGPKNRWRFKPKRSAPILPVPADKVRTKRRGQKLAGSYEIKKIVDGILDESSGYSSSGMKKQKESPVKMLKPRPVYSRQHTFGGDVPKNTEEATTEAKKSAETPGIVEDTGRKVSFSDVTTRRPPERKASYNAFSTSAYEPYIEGDLEVQSDLGDSEMRPMDSASRNDASVTGSVH